MSHFFLLSKKMIKIVYIILVIIIKDLKVYLGNLNLLLEKVQLGLNYWFKKGRLINK